MNGTYQSDERISNGVDEDSMCGGFEGGKQDQNKENEAKLYSSLPKNFKKMETEISDFFTLAVKGVFVGKGGPSLWATTMLSSDWIGGDNSILAKMKVGTKRRDNFERHLVKHVMGKILRESNNYVKCMHFHDAAEAERHYKFIKGTKGRHESWWTTAYRKSLVFPEYDTDPLLMCQVAHWYPATDGNSHENAFVALDTIETFDDNSYNFTWAELYQESWRYYKTYGNEVNKVDWMSWALGSSDVASFHLPHCVNDHLGPYDLNPSFDRRCNSPKGIRYPFMCGPLANETQQFREAPNTDEQSMLYNRREKHGRQNELFSDVIPRVSKVFQVMKDNFDRRTACQ